MVIAFSCSIAFKIKPFDFSFIPLGLFDLSYPVLINLNSTNYLVTFEGESIKILNLKSSPSPTFIRYDEIINVGSKDKFKKALYIRTNEGEHYLPSCVENFWDLSNEIRHLPQRNIPVDEDAVQVFLKNHLITTRHRRLSWFLELCIFSTFSYVFFNISLVAWMITAAINMIFVLIYAVIDQFLVSKKIVYNDLGTVKKMILSFNHLPKILSTLVFLVQSAMIIWSLL